MNKLQELQNELYELEESLYDVVEKAKYLYSLSKDYRCFGGQLNSYLIGTLKSFIENENQPGSIASLQHMLDNNEENYEEDEIDED